MLSCGPIHNEGGGNQITQDRWIGRHLIVVIIVIGFVQPTAQNGAVLIECLHRRLDGHHHGWIIGINLWLREEGHRGAHEGSRTIHIIDSETPGSDRDNVVAAIFSAPCLTDPRAHTDRVELGVLC